jgi:phosphoribosylformimino-5-aminoimidazole carboxamide ribonucleotide (ProFAR) isomerase
VIGGLALTNTGLVATWLDRFGRDRVVLAFDVKPDDRGCSYAVKDRARRCSK